MKFSVGFIWRGGRGGYSAEVYVGRHGAPRRGRRGRSALGPRGWRLVRAIAKSQTKLLAGRQGHPSVPSLISTAEICKGTQSRGGRAHTEPPGMTRDPVRRDSVSCACADLRHQSVGPRLLF